MGIVLKVTPEVLTRTANDIEKKIDDIQRQFRSIEEEINHTRSFWEGEASDAHKAQYEAIKNEISESVNRLKKNPTNLLQMAGLYTETETNLTAVSQALSDDVIV